MTKVNSRVGCALHTAALEIGKVSPELPPELSIPLPEIQIDPDLITRHFKDLRSLDVIWFTLSIGNNVRGGVSTVYGDNVTAQPGACRFIQGPIIVGQTFGLTTWWHFSLLPMSSLTCGNIAFVSATSRFAHCGTSMPMALRTISARNNRFVSLYFRLSSMLPM
jgi:hypothetical protein